MNLAKYFGIQLILSGVIILANFYLDSYINKPFDSTDFLATIIGIVILVVVYTIQNKLKEGLNPISIFKKILSSALAIFIAVIVVGVVIGEIQF